MRGIIDAVKTVARQRSGSQRTTSAGSADHHRRRPHWRRWFVGGGKQDATADPHETDRAKPAKSAVDPPAPRTQDYWHLRGG